MSNHNLNAKPKHCANYITDCCVAYDEPCWCSCQSCDEVAAQASSSPKEKLEDRIAVLRKKLGIARGALYSVRGVMTGSLPKEDCTLEDINSAINETIDDGSEWPKDMTSPDVQWVVLWDPPINKGTVGRIFNDEIKAWEFFRNQQAYGGGMTLPQIIRVANYLWRGEE